MDGVGGVGGAGGVQPGAKQQQQIQKIEIASIEDGTIEFALQMGGRASRYQRLPVNDFLAALTSDDGLNHCEVVRGQTKVGLSDGKILTLDHQAFANEAAALRQFLGLPAAPDDDEDNLAGTMDLLFGSGAPAPAAAPVPIVEEPAQPPLRQIVGIKVASVNCDAQRITYTLQLDGGEKKKMLPTAFDNFLAEMESPEALAGKGFALADGATYRMDDASISIEELARNHFGMVRREEGGWQPAPAIEVERAPQPAPVEEAPALQEITRIVVTGVNLQNKTISYDLHIADQDPLAQVESLTKFADWVSWDADGLAQAGFKTSDDCVIEHEGRGVNLAELAADVLHIAQAEDGKWHSAVRCPEVVAERNAAQLYLLLGNTKVTVNQEEYPAFIAGLNNGPRHYLVDGTFHVVSRDVQVKGHGAEEAVGLPDTWEELQGLSLPVRLAEAVIAIRENREGIPTICLDATELNPASQWTDTVTALRGGVSFNIDGQKVFVDNNLRVAHEGRTLSLEQIATVEQAQAVFGVDASRFAEVTRLQPGHVTIARLEGDALVVQYDGQEATVSQEAFRKPVQIGESWYLLPQADGFNLPAHMVLFGGAAASFDELRQIATFAGQAGALVRGGDDMRFQFFPQMTNVQLNGILQDGTIILDFQAGSDEVRQLELTQQGYITLLDEAGTNDGIMDDFFVPAIALQPLDVIKAQWGKESAKPRVLSKVVIGPNRDGQGRSAVSVYSGSIRWTTFNLVEDAEKGVIGCDWATFTTGPAENKTHYSIPRDSARLFVVSERGEEVAMESWPAQGDAAALAALLTANTYPRGSVQRPTAVKAVAVDDNGMATFTVELDQNRGSAEYRSVDQELQVDAVRLAQHQAVARPLTVDGVVFTVPADMNVVNATRWNGERQEIVVAPEHEGSMALTFYGSDRAFSVALQGEELAHFKLAMQQGKAFPVRVGDQVVGIMANELKPLLGRDAAHARQVTTAHFAAMVDGQFGGAYSFTPQEAVAEGCDLVGPAQSNSVVSVEYLANWLGGVGGPSFVIGRTAHHTLRDGCQTTVTLPGGRLVGPFAWYDGVRRMAAAEAIRSQATIQLTDARTVCVTGQTADSTMVRIDGQEHEMDDYTHEEFVNRMAADAGYTVRWALGERPVTLYRDALYAQLGSEETDPFQVTSSAIAVRGNQLELTHRYERVADPIRYNVRVQSTFQKSFGIAELIQHYTHWEAEFSTDENGYEEFFNTLPDCQVSYQSQRYNSTTVEGREALLQQLRALTSTPTSVSFLLEEATERTVPLTLKDGKTAYRIELSADQYRLMVAELNVGRPYTVDGRDKAFTFESKHIQQERLPANLNRVVAQEAPRADKLVVNRDAGSMTLGVGDTVYRLAYDRGLVNGLSDAPSAIKVDGKVFSVTRDQLEDVTPKAMAPEKMSERSDGKLVIQHHGTTYATDMPGANGDLRLEEGVKFAVDLAKVQRYVPPATPGADPGKKGRSAAMTGTSLVIAGLAAFGLYRFVRNKPWFTNLTQKVELPQWVKARISA